MMGVPRFGHLLVLLMCAMACGRTAELTLQLERPLDPDPFFAVDRLRLVALADGERVELGTLRWDRGPVRLDRAIAPSFERLIVIGIDEDDVPIASGVSEPLDVVREPPSGPVRVYFSTIGRLSRLDRDLGPRAGGFAAALSGGVLFGGGLDAAGCARTDVTELGPSLEIVDRPRLEATRVEAHASGDALGPVLLTGGLTGVGCSGFAPASDMIFIAASDRTPRTTDWIDGSFPEAAAITELGDGGFVVAGGRGEQTARTAVHLVDADASPVRISGIGQLDRPRAGASAARISTNRVLFAGGQAATSTRTLIADASAFDLSSGRTVAVSTVFDRGRASMARARVVSGSLVFAGGVTGDGASRFVGAVPVDPDASGAVGRAESLGSLAGGGAGRLLDLQDGSLLFVPNDPDDDLTWIRLLPRAARTVPRSLPGAALVGDVLSPGLAVLFADDGSVFSFHSGPAGALSRAAPAIGPPGRWAASGLTPSQPSRTSFDGESLMVEGPELFSLDALPEQLVVIAPVDVTDFELTLSYRVLDERARPSIVYGLAEGDYDHLLLEPSPRVVRSPLRRGGGRVECDPVSLPELAAVGPHRIRVRRSGGGRRVALDLGADGTEELSCDTPIPRSGAIALGVVNGRVAFDGVRLRTR